MFQSFVTTNKCLKKKVSRIGGYQKEDYQCLKFRYRSGAVGSKFFIFQV